MKHEDWKRDMSKWHHRMVTVWCSVLLVTWMAIGIGLFGALFAPSMLWVAAGGVAANLGLSPAQRARRSLKEAERYASERGTVRDTLFR